MSWGLVAGAAVSVVGGYISSKNSAKATKQANQQAIEAQDPYGPYRDAAAQKLNKLMDDPSSITDTAEYKARLSAAGRTMAAQGYTGSGNALAAAAGAGADVYQQAFNNLALASGAGVAPGAGTSQAAQLTAQQGQQNVQNTSDLTNSAVYWGNKALNAWNNSGSASDLPAVPYGNAGQAPPVTSGDLDTSFTF